MTKLVLLKSLHMLRHLHIQNYALIERVDIDLKPGFSVITGETGSGKSILLGALGLVLGKRADTAVLFDKDKKCIIEAEFGVEGLEPLYEQMDLDFEAVSTFRREITPSGRSRAFVNDTPLPLADLRTISSRLVDIHSQHETLLLQGSDIQLQLVDAFAADKSRAAQYVAAFKKYREIESRLKAVQKQVAEEHIDKDYLLFQINELSEAELATTDIDALESEAGLLENAGEIKAVLTAAHGTLSEDQVNVIGMLREIEGQLARLSETTTDLAELHERVKSCRIELDDVAATMLDVDARSELDPERLAQLQERINEVHRLENKHRVSGVDGLRQLEEELLSRLERADSAAAQIADLQAQRTEARSQMSAAATALTKERRSTITRLEKSIQSHFPALALTNAALKIELSPADDFSATGLDDIDFLFRANKGGTFAPLRKTASGGELSRVMLVLKSVLASKAGLPTLIFDEIDTGVSGDIASRMAEMLLGIADGRQVIAISHLAQVASRAETHYRISKTDTAERTLTSIDQLAEEERIMEIASMLSGKRPTEAGIANAKELMNL